VAAHGPLTTNELDKAYVHPKKASRRAGAGRGRGMRHGRGLAGSGRHCFTYIGSPNGPIQRSNPVRYVQYECYETTARSETRKLACVRPARCPAWRIWP
jgi:hypothetical protein